MAIDPLPGSADPSSLPADHALRSLVDGAPFAIRVAREGRAIWVNDAYRALFGIGPDVDVEGHRLSEQVAPDDRAAVEARVTRRARGEPVTKVYEATGLRQDGSTFPALFQVSSMTLPEGVTSITFISDLTPLREAEEDVALERMVRDTVMTALRDLPAGAPGEDAAGVLCAALAELEGVDATAVFGFAADRVWTMAFAGRSDLRPPHCLAETGRSRLLVEHAAGGPWAEPWRPRDDDGPWFNALSAAGARVFAVAPIVHADHVDGVVAIVSCDPAIEHRFLGRFERAIDLTGPVSGLLAERFHAWRAGMNLRSDIARTIERRAFSPVFQPIVELASRRIVGYEALTRFADGEDADHRFAAAWEVGLGTELELATLAAAVEAAKGLPRACWLNVNVSPRLLAESQRVAGLLADAGRPIVLELTEHELVTDYGVLRAAMRVLGSGVRLAVDDAGAGFANFAHIVELRPDIVKIDIALVRGVDRDPSRQGVILAMVNFARSASGTVVAEGIETPDEAATLLRLGVELGQGYLLGRPAELSELRRPGRGRRPGATPRRPMAAAPPQWARRQALARLAGSPHGFGRPIRASQGDRTT